MKRIVVKLTGMPFDPTYEIGVRISGWQGSIRPRRVAWLAW